MNKTDIEKLQAEIEKMKADNEKLTKEIAEHKSNSEVVKLKQELEGLKKTSAELALQKTTLEKENEGYKSILTEKKPVEKEEVDTDFLYEKSK